METKTRVRLLVVGKRLLVGGSPMVHYNISTRTPDGDSLIRAYCGIAIDAINFVS